MIAAGIEELLDVCLERLEIGGDLDMILSSYPGQSDELRPLLFTFLEGQQQAAAIIPPVGAQALSRAQFLTTAAGFPPVPRRPWLNLFHLRLATSTLILISVIAVMLLGTGLASADALPGDALYPVKLIVEQLHLNLVQDPPAKLELQESIDDRRLAEAVRLNQIKRRQPVMFSGLLEQAGPDLWRVGSLQLDFPQGTPNLTGLDDAYVQITGLVDHDRIEVEDLQPRHLTWSGILQEVNAQSWKVGGVALLVKADTKITGGLPKVGQSVRVTAMRLSDNRYQGLSLEILEGLFTTNSATQPSGLTITPLGPRPTRNCGGEAEDCQPAVTATLTGRRDEDRTSTRTPTLPTRTLQATRSDDDEVSLTPAKASATPIPQTTKTGTLSTTSKPATATSTRQAGEKSPSPTPTPKD